MRKNVELLTRVVENIKNLKKLDTRNYLIYKKYNELLELISDNLLTLSYYDSLYKNFVPTLNDVDKIIEERHLITIDEVSKEEQTLFKILLQGTTLMELVPNPGRNLKFFVKWKNKVLGFIILGSDVLNIKNRELYIGWDKKTKLKNIQKTQIQRIIVPVQPLGYVTNLGKLIQLMCHSPKIEYTWMERYNTNLYGITTTSLFGNKNGTMYDGLEPYIKNLGLTSGQILIHPDDNLMKEIHQFLRTYYPTEYQKQISKTGPKQNVLNLFFKVHRDELKSMGISRSIFKHGFKRGLYFMELYKNTRELLRDETTSIGERRFKSEQEIVEYWYRKTQKKRIEKWKSGEIEIKQTLISNLYEKLLNSNLRYDKFVELNTY